MQKILRSLMVILAILLTAFLINKMIARQIIIREANDPADKVVMLITGRGGMCADGPCQYPIDEIRGDGSYTNHDKLTEDEIKQLRQIIRDTDFTKQLPSDRRHCDSYVDGRDAIWTFPEKYGSDRRFVVCETDVPQDKKQRIFDLLK